MGETYRKDWACDIWEVWVEWEGLGAGVLLGGLGDFSLAAEVGVVEHDVFEERFHAGAGEAWAVHV